MHLTWFGHASFQLKSKEATLYIDPYFDPFARIKLEPADIILVSHWHFDHCTIESVNRIRQDSTALFGTAECAREMHGVHVLGEQETWEGHGVKITAIPAYGRMHPRGSALGFVIELGGKKVCYASVSDVTPELLKVRADIVLIPVGGTRTMRARDAARAVLHIKPKIAIPMHYGMTEGTIDDALQFQELVEAGRETEVLILEKGKPVEL